MFSRVLLSAAVILGVTGPLVSAAVTPNRAYNLMRRTDVPTGVIPECQTLVAGQKDTDGTVCLTVSDGNLIVTYSPATDVTYEEVHVWVGTGVPPTTAPGQFPYTSGNGFCEIVNDGESATCTIPLDKIEGDLCETTFSIATHADVGAETGWGDGDCIKEGCNPWASYSTFKFDCGEAPPESPAPSSSSSSTIDVSPTETEAPTEAPSEAPSETPSEAPTPAPTPCPTKITTTTVTYTTTTCPVSKPCQEVKSTAVVTATLIATVTVPCETSTYVSEGVTTVTTITKAPITTYVPCPTSAPPPPAPIAPNATYPIATGAPVPTKPGASPFTGGSSSLGISFGSLLALVALFGLML